MHNRVILLNLGPDQEHFLVPKSGGMSPLSAFARPYVNLGEEAIDHRAKRSRWMSTRNTVVHRIRCKVRNPRAAQVVYWSSDFRVSDEYRGKPGYSYDIRLRRVRVNDVSDDVFKVK